MIGLTIKGEGGKLVNYLIRREPSGSSERWRLTDDTEPIGAYLSLGKLMSACVAHTDLSFFGVRLVYPSRLDDAVFTSRQPGEVVRNPLFERDSMLADTDNDADDTADEAISTASGVEAVTLALSAAQRAEREHTARLQQIESTYDNLYGTLPFDEGRVNPDNATTTAQSIAHEIALTKASIDSQKSELLRLKANRVKADEMYMMLQDELRTLIAELETTEQEFEARRTKALQLESLDKATVNKISEKQQVRWVVCNCFLVCAIHRFLEPTVLHSHCVLLLNCSPHSITIPSRCSRR